MDDETAELILTTQLQDLEDVRSKSAGKGREGDPLSDSYLALQLQREELEQAAGVVTDRRMAQSIHRAVQDDGASIVILASEENQAAADRSMACRLDGQAPPTGPSFPDLMADDATLIRYGAFNIQDDGNETAASVAPAQDNEAESSTTAATRKRKRPNDEEECIACREVKPIVEAPCQHLYCRDCVRHLFNNAVVDETLFPPRCCRQQIPVSLVRRFLGPNLTISFERKAIEYGTTNRTYCSDATCATFIDPTHMHGSTGICPRRGCGNLTCITCKRTEHVGACPREDPFEDTIRLAQEAGWQRCERCQNMVELRAGCNRIT